MTARTTSSRSTALTVGPGLVVDHHARWRPRDRKGRVCGYTFRRRQCRRRGAHYCEPRADRVVAFFAELLMHTKGPRKRTRFVPPWWQEHEVLRPLFGEVLWSQSNGKYVRRYRIAYLIEARKNGKSEIAAGIQLYLLIGDDEESAEVYSAARDIEQASKVFGPALRMVQLEPKLRKRLRHFKDAHRLVDEKTASVYQIITSDAAGELGHNPHGFNLDEVLAQRDGSLWDAMTTAVGAREQELLYATTTETNDNTSFGADLIDEAERIQEKPSIAPHIFSFVRKMPKNADELDRLYRLFAGHPQLPVSTDWHDERNWYWPNPALGDFKDLDAMRRQALEAKDSKRKELSFLQFQLNQRVQNAYRYVPLDLYDQCTGELMPEPSWLDTRLAGGRCWGGLDLSSKLDLTAFALLFDDGWIRWRFWLPESVVPLLDEHTDGKVSEWVEQGWIAATEGDTIDYELIYDAIEQDHEQFAIANITYDKWSGEPVRQEVESRTGLTMVESGTTYERMTAPMTELMRGLKAAEWRHGGNPVARWNAEHLQGKHPSDDPDRVRPVKPDRQTEGVRIDGMPALLFAIDGRMRQPAPQTSIYETRGLTVLG